MLPALGVFVNRVVAILALTLCLARDANAADESSKTNSASPLNPESAAFFEPSKLQIIRLEISAANIQKLSAALPKRIFVPGSLRWNDQSLTNIGIRYKGNSSSSPGAKHKRSFLIKFSEFEKGQRFLGLRRVALDNGIQFGSLFSERLITDVLRDLGLPASRCNYARVYLNGKYLGIHVNVERMDESFLERHFGDASGPLFKVHETGPGADLINLGADPKIYERTFDLETSGTPQAYQRLVEFIQIVNLPKPSTIPTNPQAAVNFARVFDLDSFIKTVAVLLFAGAFDQYTGWGPHNYYLYQNPKDLRWSYLPWDLDVGFADNAFGKVPVIEGWNAAWPIPLPERPLLEWIVSDPVVLQRYRQEAKRILEKYFHPDILIPKLRSLHEQIRADLKLDPYPPRRATNPADRGYDEIVASMEAFIRKRYALASIQLENPGPRPENKLPNRGGRDNPPEPGRASADAPSELRVVRQTPDQVELEWKDNAEGEGAFIVQKCHAVDGAVFQNAIGRPGENVTSAVDRDVKPGMTYRYRVYAVRPTPEGPKGTGVSIAITVKIPNR